MAVVPSTFYMNSPLAACCLSLWSHFCRRLQKPGGSGSLFVH